jgi:hypothetical protein
MAVIAMYAEQVERLRQALGRRKFKRSVKIDTVDSFEGREEDLVVISLVRSNERGRIGFLRVPNRLNVAISRARRLVACIGDSATLRAGEESMYGVLVEAARSTGGWLSASELVTPTTGKRTQAPRRRQAAAEGEGEVDAAGRPARRRRRRGARRPGQQQVAAVPGSEEQAAAAPATPAEGAGEGTQGERRRRRRRRRGRGTGAGAAGEARPEAGAAGTPSGAEAPEGGGDATRARRRRRRRRSGRGGADGAAPAATEAPAAEAPAGGGDG